MRSNLLICGIYASLLLPIPLLSLAWRRNKREKATLVLLLVSGILLLLALVRNIRGVLLGGDYSNRLYVTIGVNMLLAAICGLYLVYSTFPCSSIVSVRLKPSRQSRK